MTDFSRACYQYLFLVLLTGLLYPADSWSNPSESTWFERTNTGTTKIKLYFFWSRHCPHCLEARPVVEQYAKTHPDVILRSYQLIGNKKNIALYEKMAAALGQDAQSVPAIMICKQMQIGYDPNYTRIDIDRQVRQCRDHLKQHPDLTGFPPQHSAGNKQQEVAAIKQRLNMGNISNLTLLTVMIAAVDAFNPCAFFVLMFLMSMMLHSRSRKRMLLVGGIFVFFSGLLYFLFMTAWLNLFRLFGSIQIITLVAAIVVLVIGVINIKDFFWFKRGVSASIPDSAKPKLFERMRSILSADHFLPFVVATIGLAVFANLYEFLCTAGFPLAYTRILTLNALQPSEYYAYLALYNVVYIVPLAVIVGIFVWTMNVRKLQETQGQNLKLLSGILMTSLGLILLLQPDLLHSVTTSFLLVGIALLLTIVLVKLKRTG